MGKNLKKVLAAGLVSAALMSCCAFAYADDVPIQNGTPDGAAISEQVDEATNKDPEMGTEFWMYLEPDPVTGDVPMMGDSAPGLAALALSTCATGLLLIGVRCYAVHDEKQKEP